MSAEEKAALDVWMKECAKLQKALALVVAAFRNEDCPWCDQPWGAESLMEECADGHRAIRAAVKQLD